MKNLYQFSIVAVCAIFVLYMSGCERQEEVIHDIVPQLSSGVCADISTDDIDLSEGFRGAWSATTGDYDFNITEHDPMYSLAEGHPGVDCDGVCAFRVEFEPKDPHNAPDVSALQINNIQLSYEDAGSTIIESVTNYVWSYPHLEVYDLYTNATLDFSVAFANNMGWQLSIADIEVLGGLCVIENVDKVDPPKYVNVNIRNNHTPR